MKQLLFPGASKGQLLLVGQLLQTSAHITGHRKQGSYCRGFGHCQTLCLQVTFNPPHRKHMRTIPWVVLIYLSVPVEGSPSVRPLHRPLSWASRPRFCVSRAPAAHSSHPNRISHLFTKLHFTGNNYSSTIHPLPHHLLAPHSPSSGQLLVPQHLTCTIAKASVWDLTAG